MSIYQKEVKLYYKNAELYNIEELVKTDEDYYLMSRLDSQVRDKPDWKFKVSDSLKDVLTGANFIITSILSGTFEVRCPYTGKIRNLSVGG